MIRRFIAVTAAAVAVLATAACGEPQTRGESESSDSSAEPVTLEEVQEAGTLVVGTEGTYPPFTYHEGGSGELTGYDVDVAEAVGEKLGVDVQFEETQWDALLSGLKAGRFDMVANQVTLTEGRQEDYTFSEPYTYSNGVVVTRSDDDSISSFEDLDGTTTAQSLTSNWYNTAEEAGAEIEPVEGWAQSVDLLEQGRVDATINDRLSYLNYQEDEDNTNITIAVQTEEQSEAAMAFPKGSDSLARAVDEALDALAEDGTLTEISEEHFGADYSTSEAATGAGAEEGSGD
ncbi:amino acid ABC transporter substrate-binding protein [Nesterenkonia sp. F]|uniref:amino acid ABC transporter substrate-binding protein n=1 Tax=Nesterenkonia sp. F TaxID=795955 RepID=UPI000255D270|nr:amino acid ABC transporter substrate-binding protein [Nesterenkonia sp. F]